MEKLIGGGGGGGDKGVFKKEFENISHCLKSRHGESHTYLENWGSWKILI